MNLNELEIYVITAYSPSTGATIIEGIFLNKSAARLCLENCIYEDNYGLFSYKLEVWKNGKFDRYLVRENIN